MCGGRAAAAPLALQLNRTALFSCRFFGRKYINLLELESLISLLKRVTREGMCGKRLVVPLDSRVVIGAVSKGRSSSRKMKFLLRKLGFWCFAYDIALERVWVPTWANPPDAPSRNRPHESWYASLPKLLPPPPMPSRSWIYSLNHSQQLSVRQKNKYVNSNPRRLQFEIETGLWEILVRK